MLINSWYKSLKVKSIARLFVRSAMADSKVPDE